MRLFRIALYALLSLVQISCLQTGSGRNVSDKPTVKNTAGETRPDDLPLPNIPDNITLPEERAAYIINHFWDGMDFNDTLRCRNQAFMEQNFVNFISLFPHTKQERLSQCIGKLLKAATVDTTGFKLVNDIAERYLDDPNSPIRNEEYYILFLEELLRLPGLPEAERVRPATRLKTAKKNRPGTKATDFAYTDRNGNRGTLHATQGKRLLLLFYDPACSHCSEILDGLRENAIIGNLIRRKELTVLAVYTEGDRKLWNETKNSLPQEWHVAIDDSRIAEHELYSLPAMPVIYMLDKDKKVLLKDPAPAVLEVYFMKIME